MKCCGSCSLTDATFVLGVLYALYAIGAAAGGQWFNAILGIVVVALIVVVCFKKHEPQVRKMIFIVVTILQTISVVGLIIAFLIIMTTDWITDTCVEMWQEDPWGMSQTYDSFEDCES